MGGAGWRCAMERRVASGEVAFGAKRCNFAVLAAMVGATTVVAYWASDR